MSFWSSEQEALRASARTLVAREVLPHLQDWEDHGAIPRDLHRAAAQQGLLGVGFSEDVGGSGGGLLTHGGADEVLDDLAAKLLRFTG